jgi:short-subunit dehydrogenase
MPRLSRETKNRRNLMKDLTQRTALLTGAAGGIGPHLASRLHAEGVSLVLSGRNQAELERLASQLAPARVVVADLSQPEAAERLAAGAGAIDLLVANAAVPASGELVSFSVEEIDRALTINLRSAMVLANRLLPGMLSRGSGHIVLMASIHGKLPAALVSVYNATKFGLRGFGLALGQELQHTGVGVSVINPTFVRDAGMWAETGVATHPLAGRVSPDQVADAVVEAIKENRREVDVAPLGARLAVSMPRLVAPMVRRLGALAVPRAAVDRQLTKR